MDGASRTVEVLLDAYQFARHNQFIADLAPLQLYASALVFAPDSSTIKTLFKPHMPSWLLTPPKIEGTWRSDVLKFEGHTMPIRAIAFSPDDRLLGTCSRDGTTRIWDTIDASCSLIIPHDENNYLSDAIAFSSGSSKVAVAYSERDYPGNVTVMIHSTRTGISLRTMQCPGPWSSVLRPAIAFEDDEIVLVAADEDRVQVLRSVNDSNTLIRHWTPHFPKHEAAQSHCVCISQDASLIWYSVYSGNEKADGSSINGSSISFLDPKSRVVTSECVLKENILGIANFSGAAPVYRVFDYGTSCSSVRSLDVDHHGESTHLFECADGSWNQFSLATARDRVAFNLPEDFIIHVKSISESKMVGELMEASFGRQVTVAPRGNLVANWDDGSLTVFTTQGLVVKKTTVLDFDFNDTIYEPKSLMISPDCQYVALEQDEGTTVWNIETEEISEYNMIKKTRLLAFSNDNQLMATRKSESLLLGLWDLKSDRMLLETNLPDFRRLKFSADGRELVTDCGRFHIATAMWTTSDATDSSSLGKDVNFVRYSYVTEWIQFDDKDLLWIPDEYRTDSRDAQGGTVALGQNDGSVLIMMFSDPSVTDSVARV
jgi:WD40 repeat protein